MHFHPTPLRNLIILVGLQKIENTDFYTIKLFVKIAIYWNQNMINTRGHFLDNSMDTKSMLIF